MAGAGTLGGAVRRCRRHWRHRLGACARVLRRAGQTRLGSAGRSFRASVDTLIYSHGSVRVAGVARARLGKGARRAGPVRVAACAQRPVVMAILRLAPRWPGLRRHPGAARAHHRDDCRFCTHPPPRGLAAGSLPGLGELRDGAQLFCVAAKSSAALAASHAT